MVNRYRSAVLFKRPSSRQCSGALFFIICVNDLEDKLSSVCELFADDLRINRPFVDPAIDFH